VLVGEGTPAELQARADNHNAVAIALATSLGDKAAEIIRAMPEILRVSVEHSGAMATVRAYPRDHAFVADIVAARLRAQALDFHELHTEAGRLDLVFRQLTLPSQAA
jgi:ABC-2 type transport system ATP-binding protein